MRARLLDIAENQRAVTTDDLLQIRLAVGAAGFDPSARTRAGLRVAGQRWAGRILTSSDQLTAVEAHYLRHVVARSEWPPGTSLGEYLASLRAAVENPAGGIYLSRFMAAWSIAFVAPSQSDRGPEGGDWILVEYRPEYGFWVTGFQPDMGLSYLITSASRTDGRWLQAPS